MHTLTPGYTQKKSIVLIIFSSKKLGLTYSVAQSASLHVSSYFFWLPDPTRPCLPRTTLISSLLRTQNTSTFGEKNKNMCENPFTPICSCRKIQVFFIKSATSLSTACSPKLQRYTFSSLLALGGGYQEMKIVSSSMKVAWKLKKLNNNSSFLKTSVHAILGNPDSLHRYSIKLLYWGRGRRLTAGRWSLCV